MRPTWSLQGQLSTALCLTPGPKPKTANSLFTPGWDLRSRIENDKFTGLRALARPGTLEVQQYPAALREYRRFVGASTVLFLDAHGWKCVPHLAPRSNSIEENRWRLELQDPPLAHSPGLLIMGSCYAGSRVYRDALRKIVAPGTPILACENTTTAGDNRRKGLVCDVRTVIEPALRAFVNGCAVDEEVVEPAHSRGWRIFPA